MGLLAIGVHRQRLMQQSLMQSTPALADCGEHLIGDDW
jgi:hypothetical protein